MKESKRRQSLSGAVLIMVLTVMFVLIILLTATLTTVTTANQRIYTKFEENQAYYTARSALDVVTQNIMGDKKYFKYNDNGTIKEYIYDNNQKVSMKQGLALDLDLYSITSQNGMNIKQSVFTGYANTLSGDASKDEYKYYFGTQPTAGTDINEIYYNVELPRTEGGANKYGKLSDYSSGTSVAKVKIEVLNRSYDMGTYSFTAGSHAGTDIKTYLDSLSDTELKDFFDNMTANEANDIAAAIVMGDRQKDKMRVKITASSTFDGVWATAALLHDTYESKQFNPSQAVTSLSQLNQGSGFFAIGGASALYDGVTNVNQDSLTTGSMYIQGSLNGQELYQFLDDRDTVFVKGDMYWANNNSVPKFWEKGVNVFIGGDLTTNSGVSTSFGGSGKEANLIVGGTFKYQESLADNFYGNIYCNKLDLSSDQNKKFGVKSGGKVYTNDLILSGSYWLGGDPPVLNITVKVPSSTINVGNSIKASCTDWTGAGYTVDLATNSVYDALTGTPYVGAVNITPDGPIPTISASNKVNADWDDYTKNPVVVFHAVG